MQRPLLAWIAGLTLVACGGTSSSTPTASTPLTVVSVNVAPGQIWPVNRPVDIEFDRPIQFGTVSLATLRFVDGIGNLASGSFLQPLANDGSVRANVVRFQPACPQDLAGTGAGFEPGGSTYTLLIPGLASGASTLLSTDDEALAETFERSFTTPSTTIPAQLFHDPVPGPPRIAVRGAEGVPAQSLQSTYLEIEPTLTQRAYFLQSLSGQPATLDAAGQNLLPNGLPLNHRIDPLQHLGFVVYLNQPINPAPENLARVQVEALTDGWKPLEGTWELLSNCTDVGTAVRFVPEALLPRGTTLRIVTAAGLQDLTLDATIVPSTPRATVATTVLETGIGARGDGIWVQTRPNAITGLTDEDLQPDFPEARAMWDPTGIFGVQSPDGVSRTRSRWIPLGEGAFQAAGADIAPRFWFAGLNLAGEIPVNGTQVVTPAPLVQGVPLINLQSQTIVFPKSALTTLDPAYSNQLNLLRLLRVDLEHTGSATRVENLVVSSVHDFGTAVQLTLSGRCFDTGDCVPLDLLQAFSSFQGVQLDLVPRHFEVTTGFARDEMALDSRITITFDATRANANGAPDPLAAASQSIGWQADPSQLNGTHWDFVRFDVLFELDVSGDGMLPGEPRPKLRSLVLPFAHLP